jgi:hypothetical protein
LSVSPKPDLKAKEKLIDVQNINAVGTEYGRMLRSAVAGDRKHSGGPALAACIDP